MAVILSLFFYIQILHTPLWADATVADDGVLKATQLLQENKYSEAFTLFEDAYLKGTETATHLYNWGLSAYQTQKKGLAVGLWRRALYLDPELSPSREALEFISQELPQDHTAEVASQWHQLRSNVLDKVSLNKLLILVWIFLLTAGFIMIRYWGKRSRALRDNTPMPPLPHVGFGFSFVFTFLVLLSIAKAISLFEIRATIITNATTLRTGPSENDNSIFDLVEGADVSVRTAQNSWVLITIPTGLSGWVPAASLFQHTGDQKKW